MVRIVSINMTNNISIHALLAESDSLYPMFPASPTYFYPRSPCGERQRLIAPFFRSNNFYPRSPCGERQSEMRLYNHLARFLSTLSLRRATIASRYATGIDLFLSTLSLRRATLAGVQVCRTCTISIHALLAESDLLPSWELYQMLRISIHALLAESDRH